MDASLQAPLFLRYDGAERRRSFAEYQGTERRLVDPSTEQDHPELFYPQPDALQQPPTA
jgi:hypothetical protein